MRRVVRREPDAALSHPLAHPDRRRPKNYGQPGAVQPQMMQDGIHA